MRFFRSRFQIVWVVIAATNNNEVLAPPSDKDLFIEQKSQVAGAQVRALAGVSKPCFECICCFLSAIPIPIGNAWPGNPYFSHSSGLATRQAFRINNANFMTKTCFSTADQKPAIWGFRSRCDGLISLQGASLHS